MKAITTFVALLLTSAAFASGAPVCGQIKGYDMAVNNKGGQTITLQDGTSLNVYLGTFQEAMVASSMASNLKVCFKTADARGYELSSLSK